MIILDTNLVSEPMKPQGDSGVLQWLDAQVAESLYLTSVSLAELLVGIELLPDGMRKTGLAKALAELIDRLFGNRILPFDHSAAVEYAQIIIGAKGRGTSISTADGQIAAIARHHGFAVATRDELPFAAAGLEVINPWNTDTQGD